MYSWDLKYYIIIRNLLTKKEIFKKSETQTIVSQKPNFKLNSMTTILIVDDDRSITLLLKLLLDGNGIQVVGTAANGQIAINKLRNLSEKPDIVLIDYRMPIMDGIEASIEILKMTDPPTIIFTTADHQIREKALEIGAFSVVNKPFEFEELFAVIEKTLNE